MIILAGGVWLVCGVLAALIYSGKGHAGIGGFILGVVLGPLGVLITLLSQPNAETIDRQRVFDGQMKPCPFCAEMIRTEATVCRFCQRDVSGVPAPALSADAARILANGSGGFVCSGCNGGIRRDATTCKHCHKRLIA